LISCLKIRPGEVVTADFDVLGDKDYGQHGKISFSVSNEDKGHVLYSIENVAVGDFYDESQTESKTGALYKFCINNTMDPDSYKHVHVHFVAYLYVNKASASALILTFSFGCLVLIFDFVF
jgi:hypothetical protein